MAKIRLQLDAINILQNIPKMGQIEPVINILKSIPKMGQIELAEGVQMAQVEVPSGRQAGWKLCQSTSDWI